MKQCNKWQTITLAVAVSAALGGCGSSSNNSAPAVVSSPAFEKPTTYSNFPVTLKDSGAAEGASSVSYTGQMARHVLREQAKAIVKAPTSTGYNTITEVNNYLKNENNVVDATAIIAPASVDGFTFKETQNNEISTGKNLDGKIYDPEKAGDPIPGVEDADKAITLGWPGNKTAKEVIDLWVNYFGFGHTDNDSSDTVKDHVDSVHGYDFNQLLPKFLMGAVFYNQAVDKYLDENLAADVKPNNEAYSGDSIYTGKEHSWDEAFGYFGAAAHYGELTAQQNYDITKRKPAVLAAADKDGDGSISRYTEYNYGASYYAASFDKDEKSTYGPDIMNAWLEGRTVITNAVDGDGFARALTDEERTSLRDFAVVIQKNWEMVIAEAVYKYAGSSYSDLTELELGTETNPDDYYKHWGELKGFMLSLQYGGASSTMTKAKFEEIDNLIGYGPVLLNGNQVDGFAANSRNGAYTISTGNSITDYKSGLKTVQETLDAFYTLKAKQKTIE